MGGVPLAQVWGMVMFRQTAARRRKLSRTGSEEEIGRRLGSVVRRWREEFGWRQDDLADRSGLAQTYISKFELGQSGDPGISRVLMICLAFNRSPCDLLHAAGLLVGTRPPIEVVENLALIMGHLCEDDRDTVIEYARMLQGKRERER